MVQPVPYAGRGVGLLPVDSLGEMHVEPEEVDQLAGAVDLRLEGGLALAEHGGGVEPLAVGGGQQLGGLQEHRCPILEPPVRPLALGLDGRADRGVDRGVVGPVQRGEHPRVTVRRDHVLGDAAPDLPAADDGRNVRALGPERVERPLERRPFGAAGCVAQHGLVMGLGDVGETAHRGVRDRGGEKNNLGGHPERSEGSGRWQE